MHKNNDNNASSVILVKHADEKKAIQSAHAEDMKNLLDNKKEVKRMNAETKKLKRKLATQDRREKKKVKVLLGKKDRTHSKEMKQMKEEMQVCHHTFHVILPLLLLLLSHSFSLSFSLSQHYRCYYC